MLVHTVLVLRDTTAHQAQEHQFLVQLVHLEGAIYWLVQVNVRNALLVCIAQVLDLKHQKGNVQLVIIVLLVLKYQSLLFTIVKQVNIAQKDHQFPHFV